MKAKWFVIINPTSGNGTSKKQWPLIFNELQKQQFDFEFSISAYKNNSFEIVQQAILQGFKKIICVGGDGTLHNIINGILSIKAIDISKIKIGIIPIGTGNDWVKTYQIPINYKKAIEIIKKEHTIKQDIGKINLTTENKIVYFNNLAGIGFDAYVVYKVHKFKNLGSLAYLTGALVGLTSYKKPTLEIIVNKTNIKAKTLMLLIGICKFSGGGMQLTKDPNPTDGLFDISLINKFTLLQVLKNIPNLFNGKITNHTSVKTYKTSEIKINIITNQSTYIQADGELIGKGNFTVTILPKALNFIIPFQKS